MSLLLLPVPTALSESYNVGRAVEILQDQDCYLCDSIFRLEELCEEHAGCAESAQAFCTKGLEKRLSEVRIMRRWFDQVSDTFHAQYLGMSDKEWGKWSGQAMEELFGPDWNA